MSIPDSLIRDTSLHGVVHELPLNQDVADHILSFTNKFLTYKDDPDLFWYTLGKETCNLSTLSYHCFRNVQQAFGKSAKFSKSMDMHNIFIDFKGHLDNILCASYGINSVEENKFRKRFGDIPLTYVFYNNCDNIEPPSLGLRSKKFITIFEEQYIRMFILRFREYLDHIYTGIDAISLTKSIGGWDFPRYIREERTKIKKLIEKTNRRLDKIDHLIKVSLQK